MTFDRAEDIAPDAQLSADVCVVGSGAAGITLARQLAGIRRVILLEAGAFHQDHAAEADSFAIEHLGTPQRNLIPSRGRWYGGSTNLWFGRIARPDPIDLAPRSWVAKSGWPLTEDDLAPWLDVAAEILGVAHPDKLEIATWPSNPTIETFADGEATTLGVFLWADKMLMGHHARATIEASRDVRLVTNATVTELIPAEGSSTVRAVAVVGPGGRRFQVAASQFVLAAGGLENPRLLLASTGRSPAGLGNEHDNVGRYYLDHPRGEGLARVDLRGLDDSQIERLAMLDERVNSPYGKVQLRVAFTEKLQRREELLNHALHGYLVSDAQRGPAFDSYKRLRERVRRRQVGDRRQIAEDLGALVRSTPQLAALAFNRALGRTRPTEFVVIDQMEQEPDATSRVTIEPRVTDRFGLPLLRLDWRIGESTRRSQHRMHELMDLALRRIGVSSFRSAVLDSPGEQLEVLDMKHPSGTTRMSTSPSTGVVDGDCRVHGTPNLFIAGSSIFPTTGHFNPTLTIVALAARLADHLAREPGE